MLNFINVLIRLLTLVFLIVLIVKQVKNIIFDVLERKKKKGGEEIDGSSNCSSND